MEKLIGFVSPVSDTSKVEETATQDNIAPAAALAANQIFDAHHPLRCQRVMDMIIAQPDLTQADIAALSAILMANAVIATSVKLHRNPLMVGVLSMATALVAEHDENRAIAIPPRPAVAAGHA